MIENKEKVEVFTVTFRLVGHVLLKHVPEVNIVFACFACFDWDTMEHW